MRSHGRRFFFFSIINRKKADPLSRERSFYRKFPEINTSFHRVSSHPHPPRPRAVFLIALLRDRVIIICHYPEAIHTYIIIYYRFSSYLLGGIKHKIMSTVEKIRKIKHLLGTSTNNTRHRGILFCFFFIKERRRRKDSETRRDVPLDLVRHTPVNTYSDIIIMRQHIIISDETTISEVFTREKKSNMEGKIKTQINK